MRISSSSSGSASTATLATAYQRYGGPLTSLPCPVDLFVLTADELERGVTEGHPLLREALAHGRDLL